VIEEDIDDTVHGGSTLKSGTKKDKIQVSISENYSNDQFEEAQDMDTLLPVNKQEEQLKG
jgi:hypothetical protein